MKVLITGSAGFIGSNLYSLLQSAGHQVFGVDLIDSESTDYIGGFCDSDLWKTLFKAKYDVLIHLATTSTPFSSNQDIQSDINNNLLTSIRLFENAATSGIKNIIFASSGGATYEPSGENIKNERAKVSPCSSYGIIKLALENYLGVIEKQMDIRCVSFRISNPYGPGQRPQKGFGVVPHILKSAVNREVFNIYGDPESGRDFIYIDDLVNAFSLTLDNSVSGVFNIGSGDFTSLRDLVNICSDVTGSKITSLVIDKRDVDHKGYCLDIKKAFEYLKWEPKIDIETGMSKTYDWFLHHAR